MKSKQRAMSHEYSGYIAIAIYSNRLTPIYVGVYSGVDVETGQDSRDVDLPDGEVRSDACSPPEPKRVGFQLVIDAAVRSYPPLWEKPFGIGEHVGVTGNAPVREMCMGSFVRVFNLPVVPEHGCTSRNAITVLEVHFQHDAVAKSENGHTQKTSLEARRGAPGIVGSIFYIRIHERV